MLFTICDISFALDMTPIILFLCSISLSTYCVQTTKLENNGYSGVVVAINDYIGQELENTLISNIKLMFTEASEFLYLSTHKRAYFKDVTILVPSNWNKQSYMEFAGIESFNTADVRISDPDPKKNNLSYTQQGTTCGEQGEYIHINDEHLLNEKRHDVLYGPLGRWLTKNWAQYRYGIFEEHGRIGDETFRTFFKDARGFSKASSCSNSKTLSAGRRWNFVTKQPCTELDADRVEPKDCYYDASDDDIITSIAFAYYHPKVVNFCGSSEEFVHDTMPRTPHNFYCNDRSTWDVIMEHEDFNNNNNPPRDNVNTKPNFRIVIPSEKRFVLVFDVSASMNGSRLSMVRQVVTNFIDTLLPKDSIIGLVTFSNNATTIQPMTKLKSDAERQSVIKKLSTLSGRSSTCIACGLLEALQTLKSDNKDAAGTKIIVATDGNENEKPRISDILDKLKNESVRVYTIAYGDYADENLDKLAGATNGKTCFVQQSKDSSRSDFDSCLFQAISDGDMNTHKLIKKSHNRIRSNSITGTFNTDAKFFDLKLSMMYDISNSLKNITVLAPNNSALYYDSRQRSSRKSEKIYSVPLTGDDLGLWQYIAYFSEISQNVGVSVIGRCNKKKTIRVDGWMSKRNKKVTAGKDQIAIFARVNSAGEPITNAVVLAEIKLPNGKHIEQRLWDNGTEPDSFKNDGVYSRFFIHFYGKGRYGVTLTIRGVITNSEKVQIPFERFFVIGSFCVVNDYYFDNPDLIPPNAVFDLNVVRNDELKNKVTLNWTAPGDDFDIGQASKYEIKYFTNPSILRSRFDDIVFKILLTDVVAGSLIPKSSGEEELLTINVPAPISNDTHEIYIALKTIDDRNNTAKISNVVYIPISSSSLPKCNKVGAMYPNIHNCFQYYVCGSVGNPPLLMNCAAGTGYNPKLKVCDWPLSDHCRSPS